MELGLLLALLAILGGALLRRRLERRRGRGPKKLTDEMVHRIEEEGRLRFGKEEPLDLDEIRSEEDAFWEQTWDEPEEL